MIAQTHRDRALEVARRQGIARGRDFDAAGVPRVYLQRLRDEGVLQQVGRGLYKLANAEVASATSLAEAARIQPKGVIGLLSALQFHNLTTQTPHAVWMHRDPRGRHGDESRRAGRTCTRSEAEGGRSISGGWRRTAILPRDGKRSR